MIKELARTELRNLVRYPIPQHGRYNCLRLDKNENVVGFKPAIIKKMLEGISGDFISAYPEPFTLYQKIAKEQRVRTEQLLITAGSEMAIRYIFEAFLEKNDQVVFLDPSFAMFDVFTQICKAKAQKISFQADLTLEYGKLIDSVQTKTKLVALANPNNPTGTVIPEKILLELAQKCRRTGTILLIDEAYFYFYQHSMIKHLSKFENLVITRTFSKACGMASIRLGYAMGAPDLISMVSKLQPIDHVNAFAIKLGEYLIEHPDLVRHYVGEVKRGEKLVREALMRLKLKSPASFANFMLIDMGNQETKERLIRACLKERIILGTHIRLPFKNAYIRITLGPEKSMARFLRVLVQLMKEK